MIDALVEQHGDDCGRRTVLKTRGMQAIESDLFFFPRESAEGPWRLSSFLNRRRRLLDPRSGSRSLRKGRRCRPFYWIAPVKRRPGDAQSLAGELYAGCGNQLEHRAHDDFSSGPHLLLPKQGYFFWTSMTK